MPIFFLLREYWLLDGNEYVCKMFVFYASFLPRLSPQTLENFLRLEPPIRVYPRKWAFKSTFKEVNLGLTLGWDISG